MSIWTQVFLVNAILLFTVVALDVHILKDKIEETFPKPFEYWSMLSILSLPAWLIYLVVS